MTTHQADGNGELPDRPTPDGGAAAVYRPASPPPDPVTTACVQSETLLQGRNSVEIAHLGAIYRLQATRQGKLILTK